MKKILAGIVVILLAAGLGAPFVNGLLAERQIRETFDKVNKMYGDTGFGITVEITRYDRGFSSSEMEWKVNAGKMAALYGVKEWLFLNRMKHELTGVVAETTLTKNPVYMDFINQKLAGKDPLHITTRYSLTGTFETTTTLDAFAITEEGETVQVKPGRIRATSDKHLKHFFYEGTWDGLQVNDLATMEGFSIKSDLEMASLYLWDGYATFAIKGGRVEDANAPFSFSNLKMDCTSKYDKERNILSGKVEYGADSLSVGDKKVENPFVRLAVNGLNAKGYVEFMQQYMAAISKVMANAAATTEDPGQMEKILEQQMAQVGMQLMVSAEKLMTKGLEFQISDLRFKLAEGEVNGGLTVSLKRDMTMMQFVPLANQPALALDIFELKSHLSLPKQLLGDSPMFFEPAFPGMQTGVFVAKEQRAEHQAETKDGKLLLNGKEVQLQ
ncbi:DUF945 family protein [uncultured Desulfobulbus sp.]|uniref:YdgA family protein n=1 Tax=uncultured Desulfobulbus sp. TaxID=239745 RepID=UPI0029C663E2|nr:DUF945 family protein [uncultured Desulfobulbus sp.]